MVASNTKILRYGCYVPRQKGKMVVCDRSRVPEARHIADAPVVT
ncbi:hypothetical protein [Microseira wollei]|nr:hypothetical protein [Microseira wollei]